MCGAASYSSWIWAKRWRCLNDEIFRGSVPWRCWLRSSQTAWHWSWKATSNARIAQLGSLWADRRPTARRYLDWRRTHSVEKSPNRRESSPIDCCVVSSIEYSSGRLVRGMVGASVRGERRDSSTRRSDGSRDHRSITAAMRGMNATHDWRRCS
jgi:hypothetical protein